MADPNWKRCLLCSDSRMILPRIPDNSIDLILTDPPYNLAKHSTGNINLPGRAPMNNDVADWDRVDFNPEEWADEFVRILKPDGNLFIFTSYNQIGRWYDCLDHRFDTSNFMIWHKTNPAPKIFKAGFLNSCEMIFTCWNKRHRWNFISQAEMHNFFESKICMRPERLSDPKHPAQKPVALLSKIISIASNEGDIVFDPFMGVGSTGVAALDLKRRFIGVDISREYFNAARKRIDSLMVEKLPFDDTVNEPQPNYGSIDALWAPSARKTSATRNAEPEDSAALSPVIKWPGGKERELPIIVQYMPRHFDAYYEPFVGGGAVFMAARADRYFINDLSHELMALYRNIAAKAPVFVDFAQQIIDSWHRTSDFFMRHPELTDIYNSFRNADAGKAALSAEIARWCEANAPEIAAIVPPFPEVGADAFMSELGTGLVRKMARMKELEAKKHALPPEDIADNIETALKSALYMLYRAAYNSEAIRDSYPALHCALFFFIRNYCYSGMFRYNADGQFNVPYGGIAYNSKDLSKKLDYYMSAPVQRHMARTSIDSEDFESFLERHSPTENDFVFLDPPYDTEFSTYARNEFTHADQQRLAEYLTTRCKGRWMLVIKHTDFIFKLYEGKKNVNIRSFDKKYAVSFMNRNDRSATHLIITNY